MIAQIDVISLGTNPKAWLVIIGGTLLSLIVGRFVQAFRAGGGLKDAALAVWCGTNAPKQTSPPPLTRPPGQI
jgi:hypothetical protein